MQLVPSRSPKRRRSQSRLGITTQETTALVLPLSLAPVQAVWREKAPRLPSLILVGIWLWALFHFFASDEYYIFGITVTGNKRVSAEEIYRRAGIEGENIFFLNRGEVEMRLERSLPNIKAASIEASLPASVHIKIVEREPAYIWQVGKKAYWLDEEGVVMEPIGTPPDTITLIDVDAQPITSGMRINRDILSAARELRRWLPGKRVFQWSRIHGLSFQHDDGFPVYLGQGGDLGEKMATLRALSEDLKSRGIRPKFVDLRFSGRPYYR